jgi:hypothetical protein
MILVGLYLRVFSRHLFKDFVPVRHRVDNPV